MTEEQLTKKLLSWLKELGWGILCFDFPQSGTGYVIHPSNTDSKTEGAIIPDIIAVKDDKAVYFENKNHFVYDDFAKLSSIKSSNLYNEGFRKLFNGYTVSTIYYGIGIPLTKYSVKRAIENISLVDFVCLYKEPDEILIIGNKSIFECQ